MNSITTNKEELNEMKLLQTLKTAVNTSRKNLLDDGLLLIIWGLAFSFGFLWKYLESVVLAASRLKDFMMILNVIIPIGLIAFTIYFIFFRKKIIRTYTAISTRFVWIGVVVAHNLNVIVTNNFFSEVNFQMLHPLQMILIGFALFVTGGIYRYYFLLGSGILMWLAAVISSGLEMNMQYLIRGIADFICFVIPGILMLKARNNQVNV